VAAALRRRRALWQRRGHQTKIFCGNFFKTNWLNWKAAEFAPAGSPLAPAWGMPGLNAARLPCVVG